MGTVHGTVPHLVFMAGYTLVPTKTWSSFIPTSLKRDDPQTWVYPRWWCKYYYSQEWANVEDVHTSEKDFRKDFPGDSLSPKTWPRWKQNSPACLPLPKHASSEPYPQQIPLFLCSSFVLSTLREWLVLGIVYSRVYIYACEDTHFLNHSWFPFQTFLCHLNLVLYLMLFPYKWSHIGPTSSSHCWVGLKLFAS